MPAFRGTLEREVGRGGSTFPPGLSPSQPLLCTPFERGAAEAVQRQQNTSDPARLTPGDAQLHTCDMKASLETDRLPVGERQADFLGNQLCLARNVPPRSVTGCLAGAEGLPLKARQELHCSFHSQGAWSLRAPRGTGLNCAQLWGCLGAPGSNEWKSQLEMTGTRLQHHWFQTA